MKVFKQYIKTHYYFLIKIVQYLIGYICIKQINNGGYLSPHTVVK